MDAVVAGNMAQTLMNERVEIKHTIAVLENSLFSTYTMREGLMMHLLENGYAVTVLTHTNKYQAQVEKTGIQVVNIGSGNLNPIKTLRYILNLYRELKKLRPAVILTFSIRPAIWGNLIAQRLNIPVITNITGVGPLFSSNNIAYQLARAIYKIALQKTRKVFFQNDEDMKLFLTRGFVHSSRVQKLPGSGIDYKKFSPRYITIEQNNPFLFLFIGRLIKDKGIFEFIEAASIIKRKYEDVSFRVIGPFWSQNLKSNTVSRSDLQGWIEEGVIEYQGEKKDIRSDLALADCVVLPSYREGMSNILLEAAAMEKPVITSNTTGCREIVEDSVTGYLCRVKDADDLARQMEKMLSLSNEQRKVMGEKGREKVIKEFDKKIVLDSYLGAIEQEIP